MPDAIALTINDGATTPVAHVFTPVAQTGGQIVHVNRSTVASVGDEKLITDYSEASAQRPTHRVKLSLAVPSITNLDTNGGENYALAYTARANVDVVIPVQMTPTQRQAFAGLVANALAHATIQGTIKDLDPII